MTDGVRALPLLTRHFYFLRHGETESNVRGIVAGSTDMLLTELGHAQARAAAIKLEHRGVTEIYSSTLRRARDTADYFAHALGVPLTIIPELEERRWGDLEGKPRNLRVPGVTPPGAETPEEFNNRVLEGLSKINARGAPLIVSHSGVFRVLCRTLGVAEPTEQIANAQPAHCVPPDPQHSSWRIEML
jgi:broad specificity phosphatase PhoE